MQIFDEHTANEVYREERGYQAWVQEQKNKILKMSNAQNKQSSWNLLFPQVEHSEDYLYGKIF